MKKFVLTMVMGALCAAAPAFADSLGIYADQQGLSCNIVPPLNVPFSVWIVTATIGGSTASNFKVALPSSPGLTPLGGAAPDANWVVIGDPYVDLTLAYGYCVPAGTSLPIFELKFFATAAPPDCSYISIVDPPEGPDNPVVVDCNFVEFEVTGGQAIFSPAAACQCDVSTEVTTWGKVKSLYR